MATRVSLICLAGCLMLFSACTGQNHRSPARPSETAAARASTANADLNGFDALAQQARQQAQAIAPDAVLRQVDVVWASQQYIFRFTDAAATQELVVNTLNATTPPQQWQVLSDIRNSPLTGPHPNAVVNLPSIHMGPQAAAKALARYAHNAQPVEMTLINSASGEPLSWYVTGALPAGQIHITVNAATGAVTQNGSAGVPAVTPARSPISRDQERRAGEG